MSYLTIRTLTAALIGALTMALVLGAVVLFLRGDDNAPIEILLPTPSGAIGQGAKNSQQDSDQALTEIKVYLSGAVRNPGVYTLQQDDRLWDALAAAGGATSGADLDAVNLSVKVRDEGHYHFPKPGEATSALSSSNPSNNASAQASGDGASNSCNGLIDLNTASAELLRSLPGIGEVRAAAIVSFREQNGPFRSVGQVTDVSGIGPATHESIRLLVTVCSGR